VQLNKELDDEIDAYMKEKQARWGFDFDKEEPVEGNTKYEWKKES